MRREIMRSLICCFVCLQLSLTCFGMPDSTYSGIYLDANSSNTVAVDGTTPWFVTTRTAGLWYERTFCNNDTIYEIYGSSSLQYGGPDLKTTLSGLVPGNNYTIFVVYWTKSLAENWEIKAGLSPASPVIYNFENGDATGAIILGSVYEIEGLLGTAVADEQGEIEVYVADNNAGTASRRVWYDGIVYLPDNNVLPPSFNPPNGTQPENQLLKLGESAIFNCSAQTNEGTSYQWYQYIESIADIAVGDPNDTNLIVADVSLFDEGTYYCKASNSGGSVKSDLVHLGIKQLMAHWPLDNDWLDISGNGRHADGAGTPSYVSGVSGTAVMIDPGNGWATTGTWNPSEYTDRLSLSLWAKWSGPNGTFQGLMNKRNSWSSSSMMWALRTDSNSSAMKFNNTSSSVTAGSLAIEQWQHVCVAYDGVIAKVYIDAQLVSSGAFQFDRKTDAVNVLGAIEDSGIYPFNGALDDIRIYNYDLTFEEVAILYTDMRSGESICVNRPEYDIDGDCQVGFPDLVYLIENWLRGRE